MSRETPRPRDPFGVAALVVVVATSALSAIAVIWGFVVSPGGHPSGQLFAVAMAAVLLIPGSILGTAFGLIGAYRESLRIGYSAAVTAVNLIVFGVSIVLLRPFLRLGLAMLTGLLGLS